MHHVLQETLIQCGGLSNGSMRLQGVIQYWCAQEETAVQNESRGERAFWQDPVSRWEAGRHQSPACRAIPWLCPLCCRH